MLFPSDFMNLSTILALVAQWGPAILTDIDNLFAQKTVTIAQIQAIFAGLQPYGAFGIGPGTPNPPVNATTTTTVTTTTNPPPTPPQA
jgi:hypothetical protein